MQISDISEKVRLSRAGSPSLLPKACQPLRRKTNRPQAADTMTPPLPGDFLAWWEMMRWPGRSECWPVRDRAGQGQGEATPRRCRWLVWASQSLSTNLSSWLFKVTLEWSVLADYGSQRTTRVGRGLDLNQLVWPLGRQVSSTCHTHLLEFYQEYKFMQMNRIKCNLPWTQDWNIPGEIDRTNERMKLQILVQTWKITFLSDTWGLSGFVGVTSSSVPLPAPSLRDSNICWLTDWLIGWSGARGVNWLIDCPEVGVAFI